MKSVLRAFLPALALLSLLVFSNPVAADMVRTPRTTTREDALAALKTQVAETAPGMPHLAEALDCMPTSDLLALRGAFDSAVHAGGHDSHVWIWWTIGLFVTLWWLVFDRHAFHHHCH